ncbi:MAG TPA: diacylglycerol kinase family protein, partial [Saprospiraceae bacterium]|nr:diacylglycerol kinase family protein [Saprospiraceae bacterium]
MIKHLIFIVNPFSGTSSKNGIETIIANEMDRTKYSFDIFFTEYPSHASEIVRDHKSSDIVYGFVAVGGDGTVNEVASEIIGTDKVLGVIPQGSGNGFGCAIGMSRDLVKSIRILNQSTVQSIDTGLCNDNNFVNICGIGIDGQIVYKTKSDPSRGFFKYLKTTILLSF